MGEIFFRGNNVMRGYLKNPSSSDKAFSGGWFHSGDLAVMHPDGYIQIKDRSKDIIISGGENISSIEVEGVLYRHPAVMEAAVVARPDEKWGETPCAFVGLKDGATVTEADLIAFCRANMAHFKAPKTIVFGSLPKTSTGRSRSSFCGSRRRGCKPLYERATPERRRIRAASFTVAAMRVRNTGLTLPMGCVDSKSNALSNSTRLYSSRMIQQG